MANLYDDPSTFDLLDSIHEHQDDSSAALDSFDFDFDDDGSTSLSMDAFVPSSTATPGFPDDDGIFSTSKCERSWTPDGNLGHPMQEPQFYRPCRNSNNKRATIITPTPVYASGASSIHPLSLPLTGPKRRRVSNASSTSSESSPLEENDEYSRCLAKLTERMAASAKTRRMLLLQRRLMDEDISVENKQVQASAVRTIEDHLSNRRETIKAFLSGTRTTLTDGLEQSRRQLNAVGGVNRP